jgi:hypothetical protein
VVRVHHEPHAGLDFPQGQRDGELIPWLQTGPLQERSDVALALFPFLAGFVA